LTSVLESRDTVIVMGLYLEARTLPHSYCGPDFKDTAYFKLHGHYPQILKQHLGDKFALVGDTVYPDGFTVKDALTYLADANSLYASNDPTLREWLADRTQDAKIGERLKSPLNPVEYRLIPAKLTEVGESHMEHLQGILESGNTE